MVVTKSRSGERRECRSEVALGVDHEGGRGDDALAGLQPFQHLHVAQHAGTELPGRGS
jgi:hypothetical protein